MDIYNKDLLEQHYKSIYLKNKDILLAGGTGDSFLSAPASDTRMSVCLIIRLSTGIANAVDSYLDKLRPLEPQLYYYPKNDMHITVLDILKGMPDRKIPQNIDDYIKVINGCFRSSKAFSIEFSGMTASDNAALVCGYYEYELERLRNDIRAALSKNGLTLEERYKTFSSHVTVVRTPKKLIHPDEYIRLIGEAPKFGKMLVSSMELVYHNWYDSKKTALARFEMDCPK